MNKTLECFITSALHEKTSGALRELDDAIDRDMGDVRIKDAVSEYAKCRVMEKAFEVFRRERL